jgi:hypothetical protein
MNKEPVWVLGDPTLSASAKYKYIIVNDYLLIIDLDGPKSVTNDIENVLTDIEGAIGPIVGRILYRDSEGEWDEVTGWPGGIKFKLFNLSEFLKILLEKTDEVIWLFDKL